MVELYFHPTICLHGKGKFYFYLNTDKAFMRWTLLAVCMENAKLILSVEEKRPPWEKFR
jgi:hypothetical protein